MVRGGGLLECTGFPAGRKGPTAGFSHLLSNSGGEQKRGRPPPPQWPCLERRRSGRCGDRADDLYTGLTRDVATTQYTQHLGAAVGTGAASPRTQPPRSRIVNHGLARYRWILQRPEHNRGRVRIPGSGEPKWNKN